MAEYDDKVFARLIDIANRHSDCLNDYDEIVSVCPKRLMSRGIALYGMFYPDMEISKYFIYKGKLTTNERSKNYAYYFDEKDRLRLTERYGDHKDLINKIYYYYYENSTEIVWYNLKRKTISMVGFIDCENGKLIRFVESYDIESILKSKKDINRYNEYLFDVDEEFVIRKSYSLGFFEDNKEYRTISRIKKC